MTPTPSNEYRQAALDETKWRSQMACGWQRRTGATVKDERACGERAEFLGEKSEL
jgi:hypothetical protein